MAMLLLFTTVAHTSQIVREISGSQYVPTYIASAEENLDATNTAAQTSEQVPGAEPVVGTSLARLKNPFPGKIKSLLDFIPTCGWLVWLSFPWLVLSMVWAGFKYVRASGNSKEIQDANQTFIWTLVGVTIVLLACLILELIANTVTQLKL